MRLEWTCVSCTRPMRLGGRGGVGGGRMKDKAGMRGMKKGEGARLVCLTSGVDLRVSTGRREGADSRREGRRGHEGGGSTKAGMRGHEGGVRAVEGEGMRVREGADGRREGGGRMKGGGGGGRGVAYEGAGVCVLREGV